MLLDTLRPQSARHEPKPARESDRRGRLVIVGYDGSSHARNAVNAAVERAGAGGSVLAVHVLPPAPSHLGTPYYERAVEGNHRRGLELLRQLVKQLTPTVRLETELFHGAPAEVLSRLARLRNASEIVVGSRGLGRWRSLLRKSVSHELLRVADRPVLVVPSRAIHPEAAVPASLKDTTRSERTRSTTRAPSGGRLRRTRGAEQ